MRNTIVLIAAMLISTAASACSCAPGFGSLPDDEGGRALAVQLAKRQVLAAEEVLRVRIVSRSEHGNAATYVVQVLETLKSRSTQAQRILSTGPDSCSVYLTPDEEWILLINAGRLWQCSGSSLLGGARAVVPGMTASNAASMNAWYYKTGARWLELVRTAAAAERGR